MVKKKGKQVKQDFYFTILSEINRSNSFTKAIIKEFTKQRANFYVRSLKKQGFIIKRGYRTWDLTREGIAYFNQLIQVKARSKSLSADTTMTTQIDLHALTLTQPIINKKDIESIDFSDFQENSGLKNWKEYHKRILSPIGLTITVKTQQVVINVFSRRLTNLNEVYPLIFKASIYVHDYLKLKGIITDIYETKCIQQHIAMENQILENIFSKGFILTLDLNREQEKLIEQDISKEAKVWTDSSPFRGVETNDVSYARKYLLMPEMMENLLKLTVDYAKNQEAYNENIKLHLSVMQDMKETLKEIRDNLKRSSK